MNLPRVLFSLLLPAGGLPRAVAKVRETHSENFQE